MNLRLKCANKIYKSYLKLFLTYKNNIEALQEKRGWNLQIVTSRVN